MEFYGFPVDILADYVMNDVISKISLKKSGRIFYRDIVEVYGNITLRRVFEILSVTNWGSFRIVAYSPKYMIISGKSTFAKLMLKYYGPQKEPIDHFILGVLDAWAEDNGLDIKFEEVECIAKGDDKCVFVGKPLGSEEKKK